MAVDPLGGTPPAAPTPQAQPTVHPKVFASALAGSVVVILNWALSAFAHIDQPAEVVGAEVVVVSAVIGWLVPGTSA